MQEHSSLGKSIESYCGKCKVNRDHTVMTMDGDAAGRVRCKTCGSMHKFRDPAVLHTAKRASAKTIEGEKAASALVWENGLAAAKGKERDYDMASAYRVGDIVNHQMFGKGVVLRTYVNKCDMLFKDRERLMATANLGAPKAK